MKRSDSPLDPYRQKQELKPKQQKFLLQKLPKPAAQPQAQTTSTIANKDQKEAGEGRPFRRPMNSVIREQAKSDAVDGQMISTFEDDLLYAAA